MTYTSHGMFKKGLLACADAATKTISEGLSERTTCSKHLICLPLDWFLKAISVLMFFYSFLTLLFLLDYSKVVTYKNDAVDHFLEGCLDLSSKPRIVRVGKSSRSEKLEDCLLFNVRFVGSTWAWLFETWLTLILGYIYIKIIHFHDV